MGNELPQICLVDILWFRTHARIALVEYCPRRRKSTLRSEAGIATDHSFASHHSQCSMLVAATQDSILSGFPPNLQSEHHTWPIPDISPGQSSSRTNSTTHSLFLRPRAVQAQLLPLHVQSAIGPTAMKDSRQQSSPERCAAF
ncbi:hypothetical protein C8Q70DRAFT_381891 [Cubamyces menziesii]|nr:hypothetical protein C8Q70DRAFT_381891 [Cubamyces menziesii]